MSIAELQRYCRFQCPLHVNLMPVELWGYSDGDFDTNCDDYKNGMCPAQLKNMDVNQNPVDYIRCTLIRENIQVTAR